MFRILFVCLGNICRSPMAEGILRHMLQQRGLDQQVEVDSAGTSHYHIGAAAHHGTLDVLQRNGIELTHAARQFAAADAEAFDMLIAMDADNVADMRRLFTPATMPEIHYLLDFIPDGPRAQGVPDPWYTGDFDAVYTLIFAACTGLLDYLERERFC